MCEAIDQMRRKIERGEEFERVYQTKSIEWEETNRKYLSVLKDYEALHKNYEEINRDYDRDYEEINKERDSTDRINRKMTELLRGFGMSEEEIKALKD